MADPVRKFLYDIAVRTGSGWNIDKMAAEMPLSLYYEWLAYARMNPLVFNSEYQQQRDELNYAMIVANLWNLMTGLWTRRGTRKKPSDFVLKFERSRTAKTPKQIYESFKMHLMIRGKIGNN